MTVVAPFLTFPNIRWWTKIVEADLLILDGGEHFEKMTCRNRYSISGANNPILLTVPLVNGRNRAKRRLRPRRSEERSSDDGHNNKIFCDDGLNYT